MSQNKGFEQYTISHVNLIFFYLQTLHDRGHSATSPYLLLPPEPHTPFPAYPDQNTRNGIPQPESSTVWQANGTKHFCTCGIPALFPSSVCQTNHDIGSLLSAFFHLPEFPVLHPNAVYEYRQKLCGWCFIFLESVFHTMYYIKYSLPVLFNYLLDIRHKTVIMKI